MVPVPLPVKPPAPSSLTVYQLPRAMKLMTTVPGAGSGLSICTQEKPRFSCPTRMRRLWGTMGTSIKRGVLASVSRRWAAGFWSMAVVSVRALGTSWL